MNARFAVQGEILDQLCLLYTEGIFAIISIEVHIQELKQDKFEPEKLSRRNFE